MQERETTLPDGQTPSQMIAARIKSARNAAGIIQADIANWCQACGFSSLSQPRIADIENGNRKVSAAEVWIISRILQVSPLDLLPPFPEYRDGVYFLPPLEPYTGEVA
jgi:transcriptional regulator with XRE-family HTH domain